MSASLPASSVPSSSSRPRQRAPCSVPSSSASRAGHRRRPAGQAREQQRLAQLAAQLARLVGGGAVDPEADGRARAHERRDRRDPRAEPRVGATGSARRRCRVSPKRAISRSSRCTQCASQTSSPSQPSSSRYSTGRTPKRSRQNASSSTVSAMCVCSRTPRARASSRGLGHQLARDGERRARRERDPQHRARGGVVERGRSRRRTRRGSRRGPRRRCPAAGRRRDAPRSIAPRHGWKRMPSSRAASISTASRSPAPCGKT